MKLKGILLLLGLAFASSTMWGVPLTEGHLDKNKEGDKVEVTATASKALTKAEMREMRKTARQQKRLERKQAFYKKMLVKKMDKYGDIDFSDPVKKWMWFWILGWGAGLLLWIIGAAIITTGTVGGLGGFGILALLGWLAWLFGTVSLVVWLVKMAA